MATTMSIIRYKYKADRDFHAVQFEGTSCSLRDLKRLIVDKSSRSGTNQPRNDYELIISDASTHREYKENNELIPCNSSVIITRRIRDASESLTQASNPRSNPSDNDSVHEYLRQAMLQSSTGQVGEQKPIPLETLNQPSQQSAAPEMTEDERIKEVVKESQSRYPTSHRPNTCHNCKEPGHRRNQCPLLAQASSSSPVSINGSTSKSEGPMSVPSSSRIITTQSPYQHHQPSNPYRNNHHQGNRPSHRGSGYGRPEPQPKRTTGIPRDGLIPVPRHIPGAMRDQTGASVVPRQMAQLIIEQSEKKADALAQRARQFQEKGVLPPAPPASMFPSKAGDDENPPADFLCSLCKQICVDAVITPCCHESFCDECIRTALVESEEHECPHCHRQDVAIDQINPNSILRKFVNDWREGQQQKSSVSYVFPSTVPTTDFPQRQESEEDDETHTARPSTIPQPMVRTAPIVIKMQLPGRTPSPQVTVEDEKTAQTSEKSRPDEPLINDRNPSEERSLTINDILPPMTSSESDRSTRHTPPSQVAPVSTILSSPPTTTTTTMSAASMVPHYHNHQHPVQMHHRMLYTPQIQPQFYPTPMHLQYPGMMHPYQGPPAFVTMPPVHHMMGVPVAPMNGFHLGQYEGANLAVVHPPRPIFPETSTLIGHHPTAALSKREFYMKQRDLQGARRSRSSSPSSSSSKNSNKSTSRHRRRDDRYSSHRRRKSVERRRRTRTRTRSPSRHRTRSRVPPVRERRRSSPRDQQRRRRHRSPRPPPTVSQSTQRTIIYQRHSSKDRSSRHRSSSPSKVPTDRQRSKTRDEPDSKKRKRDRRSEENESKSRRTVKIQ